MSLLHSFYFAAAGQCGGSTGVVDTSCVPKPAADAGAISNMLNIVFAFSASIAVLIIVVCGFRYILAHGDPNTTAQAKSGIVYSLVGLVVVMAAYSIVTFIVKRVA
jgi:hypothetical protein